MQKKNQTLESITIRRAKLADPDKVRYRVYDTPTHFVAVIAESALMAVKVSGISKPHKIVRDMPTEGVAIEAQKMAAVEAVPEKIILNTRRPEEARRMITELAPKNPNAKQGAFKAMALGELDRKGQPRARILPPELLSQIIEEHTSAAAPVPAAAVPETTPVAAPAAAPEPAPPPPPEPTTEERLLEMAASLPSEKDANGKELSPEEVEKLLNE